MTAGFSISNKTKSTLPRVPFALIKKSTLGEKYELSLVFIGDKRSKKLNIIYRKKTYIPNILSFSYSKNNGEIFINLNKVKKETKKFGRNFENLTAFLFIHGLMHLKGMNHSSKMEEAEKKLRQKFNLN